MTHHIDRRTFLATSAAAAATTAGAAATAGSADSRPIEAPHIITRAPDAPVVISSANGTTENPETQISCLERAYELIRQGASPTVAVVAGVNEVETNPNDMTVGYGGLPNENGVVQLDSSVMDGPSHKAGAVAALENIKKAASVALAVLQRTDHVMIVGQGAQDFARAIGEPFEPNMLTERARRMWLRWKSQGNPNDDWLDRDQQIRLRDGGAEEDRAALAEEPIMHTYGTIHCSAVDSNGDLGAVTTTSGLSYKIPGRVGDSPIIGAGMYVLNETGAGGATGRGESVIQSCGSFQIVNHMSNGATPQEACRRVLQWIADHTKREDLLDDQGRPNFNVVVYALNKGGEHAAMAMRPGASYGVHTGRRALRRECPSLFS